MMNNLPPPRPAFWRRHIVFLIGIPGIALMHYAWYKIQFMEAFNQRKDDVRVGGFTIVDRSENRPSE